ncbi:inositol-pentakisphosphate 2-kinase [Phlyctochytrium arcticum]|nr:inositol-pentakisphosphate 2-kinase [Phlyctochytrium arcticum]
MNAPDWRYKGEGNANIVLSYHGPNPEHKGHVLRLRKQDDESTCSSSVEANTDPEDLEYELTFQQEVVANLRGMKQYIGAMELLPIDTDFLQESSRLLSLCRPLDRSHKDIDTRQGLGVLIPDYTCRPHISGSKRRGSHEGAVIPASRKYRMARSRTIAVEIKPKWGFLPVSKAINSSNHVKYSTCRYCMHQHLKAANRADLEANEFCPLELYSGDVPRIYQSLQNLLVNPQKNLKIFLDGEFLKLEKERFAQSMEEALYVAAEQGSPAHANPSLQSSSGTDILFTLVSNILAVDPLLSALREHQTNLDPLDIEGIIPIHSALDPERKTRNPTIGEWAQTIKRYQDRISDAEPSPIRDQDDEQIINEFMLAATLKDVSIMCTIWSDDAPTDDTSATSNGLSGDRHEPKLRYALHVLDIDLKQRSKIPSYYELDQTIVK